MSMEYLRTMPTLRPRTNTFNDAFRVRSAAAYAIHKFFQENGFEMCIRDSLEIVLIKQGAPPHDASSCLQEKESSCLLYPSRCV